MSKYYFLARLDFNVEIGFSLVLEIGVERVEVIYQVA